MAIGSGIGAVVKLARPAHWIKNGFIFAGLIFSGYMATPSVWWPVLIAFAVFCLLSSAGYVFNDILDARGDREHPKKRRRPIPSGAISKPAAAAMAVVLWAAGLGIAGAFLATQFFWISLGYAVLTIVYSAVLKHLAIIDVITISIGFVLRATAGVAAINGVLAPESTIELSYWLLVCTFSLCLFMGFAKRMAERAALGETAGLHRRVAPFYTTQRLDHMLSVSAALAMITYILYCVSPRTMDEIGHSANMIYTIPFVLYGMFRFYALTLDGSVRGPVEIILGDKGIWAALAGWVAASVIIILHSKGLLVW